MNCSILHSSLNLWGSSLDISITVMTFFSQEKLYWNREFDLLHSPAECKCKTLIVWNIDMPLIVTTCYFTCRHLRKSNFCCSAPLHLTMHPMLIRLRSFLLNALTAHKILFWSISLQEIMGIHLDKRCYINANILFTIIIELEQQPKCG